MPPTTRKVRMAPILTSTITLLAPADSFTPRTSSKVRMKTIRKPGTLKYAPGPMPRSPHRTGPPVGQVDPEGCQLRLGVSAEADRDGHVADHIFQDQIPADDPGKNLAQGRVGIGVGAARDGNHRSQFGIAQAGKTAGHGHQQKRDGDRRARRADARASARLPCFQCAGSWRSDPEPARAGSKEPRNALPPPPCR